MDMEQIMQEVQRIMSQLNDKEREILTLRDLMELSYREIAEIIGIAEELKKLPTKFVTCHCTGVPVYKVMKNTMGDRLGYIHSGEEIDVDGLLRSSEKVKKRRNTYMKWHRFFAWATVFSFVMTMVTGYKRK